ncbi:MAG: hypothetical protein WBD95_24445 [Xanthobacteraceae bacterium]
MAVRFTSPHEMNETSAQFHKKLDRVTEIAWWAYWRINYACAVQPHPFKKMPGIVDVCAGLKKEFEPERIRVAQLAPDQWGNLTSQLTVKDVDDLRKLDVEVITIDARRSSHAAEPGNVRTLADYFDFS